MESAMDRLQRFPLVMSIPCFDSEFNRNHSCTWAVNELCFVLAL